MIITYRIAAVCAALCAMLCCLSCSSDHENKARSSQATIADNAELALMYQQDQADRMADEIDWDSVHVRDEGRQSRVRQLMVSDSLVTADDYFHAAMIMQHGGDSTAFRAAYDLAARAVEIDSTHEVASWLYAAAWDRYLLSTGQRQWYGTQYLTVHDTTFLFPIDTAKVTDVERERRGVRSLDQIRAKLAEDNGSDVGLLQLADSLNPWYSGRK
ncbi:hypothetical protein KQH82_13900 [bacterium]|nr:hypothetical protein [bacterium]